MSDTERTNKELEGKEDGVLTSICADKLSLEFAKKSVKYYESKFKEYNKERKKKGRE